MISYTEKSDINKSRFALERAASKTARKFTGYFGADALPHSVSITLDWLSMMVYCEMAEPAPDQGPVMLNDMIGLQYEKRGAGNFKHCYTIIMWGEPVANLLTHGRNNTIIKPGTAKLEVLNHVLYSTEVKQVLDDIFLACGITGIKNISEVHVAIDGANHVHTFLNKYVRQNRSHRKIDLRTFGTWGNQNRVRMKGKAFLDCKRFSRADGTFQAFKVGSTKKCVVVYDKTSELKRSHKEYIRDVWASAGIDDSEQVWRVELRMKSEAIKEIKDFSLDNVHDPNYLLSIFKTQCKNFFEFALMENDENISRARIIDLFQFEKLKVKLLEKVPRALVDGAYKAQMSIHNAVKGIMLNRYKTKQSIQAALHHITDNVQLYRLDKWFERKKDEYKQLYSGYAEGKAHYTF